MTRVLLVDDDPGTLDTFALVLRTEGYEVVTATSGTRALDVLRMTPVNVIVSDLRLPDLSGIDVLRHLRTEQRDTPFVIVTGFGSVRTAVEAVQLGAADYLEKPVDHNELISTITRCLAPISLPIFEGESTAVLPEAHALQRWSDLVIAVLTSRSDPRTLDEWGAIVHAAGPTVENWCRAAKLPSKASLDFARVLRAFVHARRLKWSPEDLLRGDKRTVDRLLATAGFADRGSMSRVECVADFLANQSFIQKRQAIDVVARALARVGTA